MLKLRINILFVLLVCIILGASCGDTKRIKKEIERIQQQETLLCLSEMDLYTVEDDKKTVRSSFENCPMRLVVYVDSALCSPCLIKGMYRWYDIIDETLRRYHGNLKTVFIFSPPKKHVKLLEYAYRNSAFGYPIFVDTTNVFRKSNPHIPDNGSFHTFLLNEKNKVVLVGCPLTNPGVKKMIFELVDETLMSKP